MNNSTFKIFTIFICGQSEGRACMYLCCPSVRPIKKLEMARNHFILWFSMAKSSVSTKSPGEHSLLWINDCLQKNHNEKYTQIAWTIVKKKIFLCFETRNQYALNCSPKHDTTLLVFWIFQNFWFHLMTRGWRIKTLISNMMTDLASMQVKVTVYSVCRM